MILSDRGSTRALSYLSLRRSASFPEKHLLTAKTFYSYLAGFGLHVQPILGKADFANTFNRLLRERNLGDISRLELILVDNSKGARVVRIIAPSVPTIVYVVDYHAWVTIVT